jgi:hypothetical protein
VFPITVRLYRLADAYRGKIIKGGMVMIREIIWLTYEFGIYDYEEQWSNVAGIYIFAGVDSQNYWVPYYIGQADSFQDRIPSHEKWDKAQSLGATHVHTKTVSQQFERDKIEQELIQNFQPSLNVYFR